MGVAVDVSGSMQSSIRNRKGTNQSRFESFQEALGGVVRASQQRAEELARSGSPGSAEALVFAYAFGLSTSPEVVDLLALLAAAEGVTTPGEIERLKHRYAEEIRQRYSGYGGLASLARSYGFGGYVDQYATSARASAENEVREKIKEEIMGRVRRRLATDSAVTLTLTELDRIWSAGPASFDQAEHFIFGGTPMRQCLEQVADRFATEAEKLPAGVHKFLVLVSDGEPTDGDPRLALERIRSQGVFVASCLVTDADTTEPRHLYAEPHAEWNKAARLMFEAASTVGDDEVYRELLEGRGWSVEDKSRLFMQINHSEMMNEFLTLAFSRTQGSPLPG
ncbi:MAG TPA: VWA domain-containing protein [Thermoanaerobaculia bacterium]|nr:VWA domain-containing protein [Thermoanaerobaculia bacterium]